MLNIENIFKKIIYFQFLLFILLFVKYYFFPNSIAPADLSFAIKRYSEELMPEPIKNFFQKIIQKYITVDDLREYIDEEYEDSIHEDADVSLKRKQKEWKASETELLSD